MNLCVKSLIDDPGTVPELTSTDMLELISEARPLVEKEKNLLDTSKGSMLVVGDLHGDFGATKYIITLWKKQRYRTLVFLGDYVDRGEKQLETINLLLCLKIFYPQRVYLLRGNHETPLINSYYGFSSVCIKKFGRDARRIYNEYNILFSYFSAAFIFRKILLVHGGIPRGLDALDDINLLPKGDLDADNEILGQMLWNDPSEYYQGFEPNWERNIYYTFGREVFLQFLEKHKLNMVIRAHEAFLEGYKYFFDYKLLSIFSSPNYIMGSKARIARISREGKVSLTEVKHAH